MANEWIYFAERLQVGGSDLQALICRHPLRDPFGIDTHFVDRIELRFGIAPGQSEQGRGEKDCYRNKKRLGPMTAPFVWLGSFSVGYHQNVTFTDMP
ncbi:MAG: hypothetical protein CL933_18905 [Deltaproteobacteria bacterium]|nr:hypothetical protein [Deltaproteobacteria bacterium]